MRARNKKYYDFKSKSLSEIAEYCRSLRLAAGYTQRDIAEGVGLDDKQICIFEQGRYNSAVIFAYYLEIGGVLNVIKRTK